MNNVRAYNMNLKDLIFSDSSRSHVREQDALQNKSDKTLEAGNDVEATNAPAEAGSVQVDISPVWKEAAANIDLKNATANEVAALSASLYKAAAITFEDHVNLSFQQNSDSDEKINFISHWNERQESAISQGADHETLNDIIRIQSILGYVDSLKG